jgi:hypothetical protein
MMTIDELELMVKETFDKLHAMQAGIEQRLKDDPNNAKIQDELRLVNEMLAQAADLKLKTGLKY